MTTVLGLRKAIQEIALDDGEDSPRYRIDLTDASLSKQMVAITKKYGEYQHLAKMLTACKDNAEAERLLEKTAKVYKSVIETILGKKAYDEIVDYVGCGKEASDINIVLTPLIIYLFNLVFETLTARDRSAVEKYLGSDAETAI